jgi:PAS domain S-box-containing protein
MENISTTIGMINNAALLLALGVLYDVVGHKPRGAKRTIQQAIAGVIVGAIGIAVMLNPWQSAPGVVFDTRSVLLSVSGLFFGTLPTLLATLMTGAFRFYTGGAGAWTGVAVIVTSGAIGVAWRHLRRRQLEDMPMGEVYAMGLIVHAAMLLWMFSLPWPLPLDVLSKISLPVMVIYPAGTALLGWLMVNRRARYRVEEALRKERDRAQKYLDTAGVMFVVLDAKGEVTLINQKGSEVLGYEREEIIGKNWFDSVLPPGMKEEVRTVFDTLMAGEVELLAHYENPVLTKGGEERIIAWHNTLLKDDAGNIVGTLSSGEDITERVRAEEALRESEKRLIEAQRIAGMGDFTWDVETGEVTWSDAMFDLLQYDKSEAIDYAKVNAQVHHPDDLERVTQWLNDCIASGRPELSPNEYRLIRKNGKTLYVRTVGVIEREEGKSAKVFGTVQDITERKRAAEELRRYQEHLEELVEERTADLKKLINAMAGREVRMAELKDVIRQLRAQLEQAGLEPVANDPLLQRGT